MLEPAPLPPKASLCHCRNASEAALNPTAPLPPFSQGEPLLVYYHHAVDNLLLALLLLSLIGCAGTHTHSERASSLDSWHPPLACMGQLLMRLW